MKKLAIAFMACLACVQSTYAATSALTESLLEYEAITNTLGTNPSFSNVIPATEFIVDIKRITHEVDVVGIVKYEILTRVLSGSELTDTDVDQGMLETRSSCHLHRHRNHVYIATLNVIPNPGIGPNIITVLSITPVARHSTVYFTEADIE